MPRQYLELQVNCVKVPGRIEPMEMILEEVQGRMIPVRCNGCEQMDDGSECRACRAWVMDTVFRNPNLQAHIPLTPTPHQKG